MMFIHFTKKLYIFGDETSIVFNLTKKEEEKKTKKELKREVKGRDAGGKYTASFFD